MEIRAKKLPQSKVELTIVLPWAEWKKEIDAAAKVLGKTVKLPGFRQGFVPRNVLEKRLGKSALLSEAAEHAVRHSYLETLKKENLQAIGEPQISLEKLVEGEALEYRATTAVLPEVKMKSFAGPVKKINRAFEKGTDEINEEDVQAELQKLAEMRAPLITVRRPAKISDTVTVDFTVSQEGVPVENGTSKNHTLVLGKNVFIPGFEEKLLDMTEGEKKKFTLAFPGAYHAKNLAGKEAEFEVTLKTVQERQLPAMDDAFAKTLGNFESLEKVKESLRHGMLDEKKAKRREERRTALLDALVEESDIEMPAVLIEREQDRMLQEFGMRAQSMGLDLENALKQGGKTKEDLRREWLPQARKRLAAYLILEKLAAEEKIEVESAAIEAEMNKALGQYQSEAEAKKIDMERLYQGVREHLRNEKIFEWLESL